MPDIFVANPNKSAPSTIKKSSLEETSKDLNSEKKTEVSHPKNTAKPFSDIRRSIHLLSSFGRFPRDMSFQNQTKDEEVLLFVRRHFITNFKWILFSTILISIPFFLPTLFASINIQSLFLPVRYFLFFTVFYYILVATYIFINFITWYFNIGLVTNIRVIDVDFSSLVYKNVAATKIDLVQDVSFDQIGALRTIFNYGDVLMQTAGASIDNFVFEAVPQPENVAHIVEELIGRGKHV